MTLQKRVDVEQRGSIRTFGCNRAPSTVHRRAVTFPIAQELDEEGDRRARLWKLIRRLEPAGECIQQAVQ